METKKATKKLQTPRKLGESLNLRGANTLRGISPLRGGFQQ